jgi:hypothetical protein
MDIWVVERIGKDWDMPHVVENVLAPVFVYSTLSTDLA